MKAAGGVWMNICFCVHFRVKLAFKAMKWIRGTDRLRNELMNLLNGLLVDGEMKQ